MQDQERKEILDRLNKAGLLYETINLSGIYKEIIIHEVTGHSARMIGQMSVDFESDKTISEDMKNAIFSIYIPLIACSEGDLPKNYLDLFDMKDADIELWTVTARKMNPQIFGLLDLNEKHLEKYLSAEAIEKKSRKRSRSKRSS